MGQERRIVSWQDRMRELDPAFDEKRAEADRNKRLEAEGCLPRSLSSVLGVALTREQEDMRLAQMDDEVDIVERVFELMEQGQEVDVKRLTRDTIANEQQKAMKFVQEVGSQLDTPAGNAMRNLHFEYESLDPVEIRKATSEGKSVVLCEVYHAAHIVPDEDSDLFTSLSDDGAKLRLPNKKIKAIVFKRK